MTRDRRRGFTLIELLVVIGVILLLIGIAVLAYQKLDRAAGNKATETRLQLCASLLSEYETATGLNAIEGPSGIFSTNQPVPANFNGGLVNVSGGARYFQTNVVKFNVAYAVYNTAGVMQSVTLVPSAKSMVGQLPSSAMLTTPSGPNGTEVTWVETNPMALFPGVLPVITDSWKNPIIFVPSAGLTNVYIGKQISSGTQTGLSPGTKVLVRSTDNRPFWASAGQDGNFITGDDNLYSSPVVYTPIP